MESVERSLRDSGLMSLTFIEFDMRFLSGRLVINGLHDYYSCHSGFGLSIANELLVNFLFLLTSC